MTCNNSTTLANKRFDLAKIIILLFFLASVILLLYTFYKNEILFNGARYDKYLKYYLISVFGIICAGTLLKLNRDIRQKIVMIGISVIAGIYFVEIYLFYISSTPQERRLKIAHNLGVSFDPRSKLEVVKDLQNKGEKAVPSVHPRNLIELGGLTYNKNKLLPLGGVAHTKTVVGTENGKYFIFVSDRYGFNNPDNVWQLERIKWALIGDSFVQGLSVQKNEDISSQIRSLTKQPVINLGSSGNGPFLELATLKEYAEFKRPEIVLWVYFEGNDLVRDLNREKVSPILINYLNPTFSQKLRFKQPIIDEKYIKYIEKNQIVDEVERKAQESLYKTRWLRLHSVRQILKFDNAIKETPVDISPLFSEILQTAKQRVNNWGGKLYFVYLPEYARYSSPAIKHDLFRKKKAVISVANKLNIPVIDIHKKVFLNHPSPHDLFPLGIGPHYNAIGYEKVAQAIVAEITSP